jgi:hypothetical protein
LQLIITRTSRLLQHSQVLLSGLSVNVRCCCCYCCCCCCQVHALADLQARLELHNRLNALELAALQDWASAHYQALGGQAWDGGLQLPTRSQLRAERGLLRQVAAQLVTAPLMQQQAQPYTG